MFLHDRIHVAPVAIVCLVLLAAAGSAALAAPADPLGGTGGSALAGGLLVRVVVDGTADPIDGAFVMVGPEPGNPFAGNVGLTNGAGEILFSDPSLTGTVSVTAGASGRGYTTFFELGVDEIVLPLAPIDPAPTARLGDQFQGIEHTSGGLFCLGGDGNLDIGFVFPAIPLPSILSQTGLLDLFLPSTTEPLNISVGGPIDAPSNTYLPEQCEIVIIVPTTFDKLSYHLRVPTGRRTVFGLTARGDVNSFLALTDGFTQDSLVQLVSDLTFRELDVIRDLDVTVDSDAVDLNADLGLTANLTMQISNVPPLTSVFAAGGGRLTNLDGVEELILTGLNAFDPDAVGPAADLTVATHPASGELSDMIPGALVLLLGDEGNEGSSLALTRSGFTPPATLPFGTFFELVQLNRPDGLTLAWSDVTSATSPPARDLNRTDLNYEKEVPNPDDPVNQVLTEARTFWTFYTRGSDQDLSLPTLPASAPTSLPDPSATPDVDQMVFSHQIFYLGDTSFSYDDFAFADIPEFTTHVSNAGESLTCPTTLELTGLLAARGPGANEITLSWDASLDICHDIFGARGYEVWSTGDPVPALLPGTFPADPAYVQITDTDTDGTFRNASFTHVGGIDSTFYLVTDRGLAGNEGPAGHYDSVAP